MSGPITVFAWSFTKDVGGFLYVYRVITFGGYLVVGETAVTAETTSMIYIVSSRKTPEAAQREAIRFTETMEQEGFEIDAWPMRLVPSRLRSRFLWLGHPKVADAKDRDWDDLWGAVITHGDDLEGLEP